MENSLDYSRIANIDIRKIAETVQEKEAEILVVSKHRTLDQINALYAMGFRKMGENRVQALMDKKDDLPTDIQWHIIGQLQSNKVKYVVPFVEMIHSVDRMSLAKKIQSEAKKIDRKIDILIQLKVAEEDSKSGLAPNDVFDFIDQVRAKEYNQLHIRGIMGMGSYTDDMEQVRSEFKALHKIFQSLKKEKFQGQDSFDTLSMGMSGDYKIAIEEGSTMVRLGSILFNAL